MKKSKMEAEKELFKMFEGEIRMDCYVWNAEIDDIFEVFTVKEIVEHQLTEDFKEHERRLSATKDTNLKRKIAKI